MLVRFGWGLSVIESKILETQTIYPYTGRQRSQKLGKQLQEANIRYEIRHILAPYAETCKDADDLLRQYGYLAYQKCFLAPYQKTDHRPLVDLAIHFFGKD
ncbi:MAG: DNA primase, partial ['Waltheria sp.' little leaf phytoplasma]|nr:DNA primase ['Waltheria sp.' little leaf phytoplasma]